MMNPFLVVAIIGGFMALLVYSFSQAQVQPIEVPSQFEEQLIALDRQALDDAYRQQMTVLFLTWMKDSTGQPERLMRGVSQSRKAYAAVMAGIEGRIRKQEIKP